MSYTTKRAVYGVHFCGNEASDYGKGCGHLDYAAFAKSFDAVMSNDIIPQMESAGFYFDPIQDGRPDNSDEIDALREEAQELEDQADIVEQEAEQEAENGNEAEAARLMEEAENRRKEADEKKEEADELEDQDAPDIFQYFIVSDRGAELIQQYTDDPLFYCEQLDMYVWGVTHWGTSWNYVLTDIRLNAGNEAY